MVKKVYQNPQGGLNAKGRAYFKRTEGANLKPPVSAKAAASSPAKAKRRKSFCSRSKGQMEMYPEAAKDPNSRLRKARRKWEC